MMEIIRKRIEGKKTMLIDIFTDFYGEEYRGYIKEKILNTRFYIYHSTYDVALLTYYKIKIEKQRFQDEKAMLDRIDFLLKVANADKKYDSIYYNKIREIFPNCQRKNFPLSFVNSVKAFSERKSKDINKNKSIERLKINYFNAMGIYLGEDKTYQDYELNEEVKRIIPTKNQINKIIELEKFMNNFSYQIKLVLDDNIANIYESITNQVYDKYNPQIVIDNNDSLCLSKKENRNVTSSCIINISSILSGTDSAIVHELLHAIDARYPSKSGLHCKDNFKMLNEVFEESIAKDIYKKMVDNNQFILNENAIKAAQTEYDIALDVGYALRKRFANDVIKMKLATEEELYKIVDKETLHKWEASVYFAIYDKEFPKSIREATIKQTVKEIENYRIRKC